MEKTRKATPQFVERAWSVQATALYTIAVYHQFSGFSSIIWNGVDRKTDTSICRKIVKSFSNSFMYNCCSLSVVRIFIDYLKKRWQEKPHFNLSKVCEVFQQQLYIRLLYIINCQEFLRFFEMQMTRKKTPHFVERARSVQVTALYTIVVYHQLSWSSLTIWNADDRKIDISICQNFVK